MTHIRNGSRVLTVEQAAEQLGVNRQTAYNAAKAGDIPVIRLGRRLLVPIPAFEELLRYGTWTHKLPVAEDAPGKEQ